MRVAIQSEAGSGCREGMTARYARGMTTQIAVKLSDALLAEVDRLVARGSMASRSEAVRTGLVDLVGRQRSSEVDEAFRRGFERSPHTDEEVEEARRRGLRSIEEEPWEPWW